MIRVVFSFFFFFLLLSLFFRDIERLNGVKSLKER